MLGTRSPAHPGSPPSAAEPDLPPPRGPVSAAVIGLLAGPPGHVPEIDVAFDDPLSDDDLHLALYVLYELHYRGFGGVDPAWEWWPPLLALRARLEAAFEAALRAGAPGADRPGTRLDDLLRARVRDDDGPSPSMWLERHAELWHLREFAVHRSAYQLKEADPHSWAIPRLHGAPKAALVEIQADEYGGGDPERVHAALFGATMRGLGLDDRYGAYLPRIPGVTLATVNAMSMFGLHRRLRGAIVGHLTVFEMTSSAPNRRYARAARRLGVPDAGVRFFDEHVEADAVHEAVAAHDLAAGLAAAEPGLRGEILFGAEALLLLDRRAATAMLGAWEDGRSSLLPGAPALPG